MKLETDQEIREYLTKRSKELGFELTEDQMEASIIAHKLSVEEINELLDKAIDADDNKKVFLYLDAFNIKCKATQIKLEQEAFDRMIQDIVKEVEDDNSRKDRSN